MYYELTPQEHRLCGSTCGYHDHPYRPVGVSEGRFSAEECNKIRQEAKTYTVLAVYWGDIGIGGKATLEPLELDTDSDDYGNTLRDTMLVRVDSFDVYNEQNKEIPYKREEPRVNEPLELIVKETNK
jgi:hypothetical protein